MRIIDCSMLNKFTVTGCGWYVDGRKHQCNGGNLTCGHHVVFVTAVCGKHRSRSSVKDRMVAYVNILSNPVHPSLYIFDKL